MFRTTEGHEATTMPFVLCRSEGGPYDDEAFLSGWRLAELASMLGRPEVRHLCECIRPGERHQADLIAMARGYTMNVDGRVGGDWLSVTFERTTDDL